MRFRFPIDGAVSKDFTNYDIAVYINDTKYMVNDFENMRMDTFFCLLNGKDYREQIEPKGEE